MRKIRRVYHHYENCEEYAAGMWRIVYGDERREFIEASAGLMKQPERFRRAMMRAITEWPNSAEHNLTASSINKIAWLGHAGCCVETGSPEDLTRLGWHTLTQSEQDEANRVAAEILEFWRASYIGGNNA